MNNKQLVKIEIRCPFCLENTNKWKQFWCHYITYDVSYMDIDGICKTKKRTTQEIIDEKVAREFETKILCNHITTCKQIPSIQVLSLYKL